MERRKVKWLMALLLVAVLLATLGLGTMGGQKKQVCYIDLTTGEQRCEGPVEIVNMEQGKPFFQVLLALHGCYCYEIVLETSNVTGNWLDLGNSNTNDGFGGDAGTFSHDSELNVRDSTLEISGNDYDYEDCPNFSHPYVHVENFAARSGEVRIQVHEGFVRIESGHNVVTIPSCKGERPCIFACGKGPDKEHGFNDDIFWLALNGVITGNPSRPGSGVDNVTIYQYPGTAPCCGCDP